jgi:hypothetical protein
VAEGLGEAGGLAEHAEGQEQQEQANGHVTFIADAPRRCLRRRLIIGLRRSAGCFHLRLSDGGGQTADHTTPGAVAVRVPAGYRIERVARGLTFPTGVACPDITLRGETFTSKNPLTDDDGDEAVTSAFQAAAGRRAFTARSWCRGEARKARS